MRRSALAAVLLASAVLAAAALGSGRAATVSLRSTSLGRVLVAANGRTLYMFTADKAKTSSCYGACAGIWPALLTSGRPSAGAGVKASLLGTSKRHDGKLQVTYAGHPLYFFSQDSQSGQTTGEGINHFGGHWWVVSAAGVAVTGTSGGGGYAVPPPQTTTNSGGGYGGGYGGGGGY
jgi:predicted lipoprotein with Yx(FWY)xxD motif